MNDTKVEENKKSGVYIPYLMLPIALVFGIAYWLFAGRYITLSTNLVPHWVGFVVLAITLVFLALLLFSLQKINPGGISALRKKNLQLGAVFILPMVTGLLYSSTLISDAFQTAVPDIFTLILGFLYLFYALFMLLTSVQFFTAKNVSPTKSPFLPFMAVIPFCLESIMLALKNPTSLYRITSTLHMAGFILAIIWFAVLIHSFYVAMHFKRMQLLYVTGCMLFLFSTCFGAVRIVAELHNASSLTLSSLAELFILPALGLAGGGVSLWIAFCGKQQVTIAQSEDDFLLDLDTMVLPKIDTEANPTIADPAALAPPAASTAAGATALSGDNAADVEEQNPPFSDSFFDEAFTAQFADENLTLPPIDNTFLNEVGQDNDTSPFGESFFDVDAGTETFDDDFLRHTSSNGMSSKKDEIVKAAKHINALPDGWSESTDPLTAQEQDFLFSVSADSPVQAQTLDLLAPEETTLDLLAPEETTLDLLAPEETTPDFLDLHSDTDNLDDAFFTPASQQDLPIDESPAANYTTDNAEYSPPLDLFATEETAPPTPAGRAPDFLDTHTVTENLESAFLGHAVPHDLYMNNETATATPSLEEGGTALPAPVFFDGVGEAPPTQIFSAADILSTKSDGFDAGFSDQWAPQDLYTDENSESAINFFNQETPAATAQHIVPDNYMPPEQLDLFDEGNVQNKHNLFEFDEAFFPQAGHGFAEADMQAPQPDIHSGQSAEPQPNLFGEVMPAAPIYSPQGDFPQAGHGFAEADIQAPQPDIHSGQSAEPQPNLFGEVTPAAPIYSPQGDFPQAGHGFAEADMQAPQPDIHSGQSAEPQPNLFGEVMPAAPIYSPQGDFPQAGHGFAEADMQTPQPDIHSGQSAEPQPNLFGEVTPAAPIYSPQGDFPQAGYGFAEADMQAPQPDIHSGQSAEPQPNLFGEVTPAAPIYAPQGDFPQAGQPKMPQYIHEPLMPVPNQVLTPVSKTPVVQSSPTVNLRVEEILAELELERTVKPYAPAPQNNKQTGKKIFKRNT